MKKYYWVWAALIALLLTSCANHVEIAQLKEMHAVGFWHGLWHGMILPFAFIGTLFSNDIAIYAVYNNGGWYDFGFFLGVGALAGGSSQA